MGDGLPVLEYHRLAMCSIAGRFGAVRSGDLATFKVDLFDGFERGNTNLLIGDELRKLPARVMRRDKA